MADYISQFTGAEIDSRLRKAGTAVQPADLESKQDTLVSGENIKTVNGQSIVGSGNIQTQAGDTDAVKYVAQTLTDAQKQQARANIGAYQKPSSGIPASDLASGVIPDISGKQDTIQDLSTIRSGATLGSTSVQPVDIENMVEAEPIGSIIPPVNPSEFSTKEEVSQLRQEVTADVSQLEAEVSNLSGKYYGVFTSSASLPDEITQPGYAFVGTKEPFSIWNFDGEEWTDTGAEATAIYGQPGEDGVGFQTITTLQDGTMVITLTSGDTITINLNHNHLAYPKYQLLTDEAEYEALTTKEADTLYLIPE